MTDRVDAVDSDVRSRILEYVATAHRAEPWSLGATSLALARRVDLPEASLLPQLAGMVESGLLARRFDYFALPEHAVSLSPEQRELFASVLPAEGDPTPFPAPFANVLAAVRSGRVEGATKALDTLLATGALTRIGDDCYRESQLAAMRRAIESHFRDCDRLTVARFRDLVGTTRKHAVPVLEWFDRRGVTRREGTDRTRGATPDEATGVMDSR